MFLTKKVPEYEQYLKREYSEAYDSGRMRLEKLIEEKKNKCEDSERRKCREEEEKKAKGIIIKSSKKSGNQDLDEED